MLIVNLVTSYLMCYPRLRDNPRDLWRLPCDCWVLQRKSCHAPSRVLSISDTSFATARVSKDRFQSDFLLDFTVRKRCHLNNVACPQVILVDPRSVSQARIQKGGEGCNPRNPALDPPMYPDGDRSIPAVTNFMLRYWRFLSLTAI